MFLSIMAMANPAPFGLEIEKTTIKELKQKYNVQKEGINKYSQGEMYNILDIDFDGIKQAKAIFDKNQKLVALYTVFEYYKFYDLKKLLSKHYQLIEDKKKFHEYLKFIDDKTEIILDNSLGFSMHMDYMSFSFKQQYEDGLKREKEEKEKKENNALFGKRVKKVDNITSKKNQALSFLDAENKVKEGIKYIKNKKYRKGKELLEKACDAGDVRGCYYLGMMYDEGEGIQQDKVKATKFYHISCEEGIGCSNLANIYAKGEGGVQMDKSKALNLYTLACTVQPDGSGCYNLGWMYATGQAVKKDKSKALQFYIKACTLGVALGCYQAGLIYSTGKGVKEDKNIAKNFFAKACDMHYQRACENYKQLMDVESISYKKIILYLLSNGYFYLFLYIIALWMLNPYSKRKMNFFKNFIAIIILIIIAMIVYLINPYFLILFGLPILAKLMPNDLSNSNHYNGGGGSCWGDDGFGDGGCGGE